jgi:hypothetical protein
MHPVLLSGFAFGVLVLLGSPWLEASWAPWAVGVMGLSHLWVYGKADPAPPKTFILVHSFIVLATIGSIILHVREIVGFPTGWLELLFSFARTEAARPSHLYALAAAALVPTLIAGLLFVLQRRLRIDFGSFPVVLYVVSTINVAWDYSLQKVMAHSLGPAAFLAAAGVFALELSLILHLLSLALLIFSRRRVSGELRKPA